MLSPVSPLPTKDIQVINQFTELLLCFAVLSFLPQRTDLRIPDPEAELEIPKAKKCKPHPCLLPEVLAFKVTLVKFPHLILI